MTYEELLNDVKHHCSLYYDQHSPEISDTEFDILYDKLEQVEDSQGWRHSFSPTLRVGGKKGKVKHIVPLYSLKKTYDVAEIDTDFDVKTPKLDGTNLTITYTTLGKRGPRGPEVYLGLTRGDGEYGEDATHLLPYISGIPKDFLNDYYGGTVVVTGECVTDNEVTNFRNYVSGALALKDIEEFKTRNIRFIVHDWINLPQVNYTKKMELLEMEGFTTVMQEEECAKYPQDGIVYRINDWQKCKRLGYTSKHPRFAIALKEQGSLTAETTLQNVIWVVGRTGTVNPVGIVDSVILDDATVSRVTLHNLEFITDHDLGLGDLVEIERAGGIIPKFNRVISSSPHNHKIEQRHAEEYVGHTLKKVGPKLFCIDESQHDTVKLVEHFVKTLEIKGLGPASVTKMKLKHPADIYQSHDWSKLGANGAKVQEQITRSKGKPYHIVLAALGIPGVGKTTAKELVRHLPSFNRLRDIETTQIKGIGDVTIDKILSWLDINEEWVLSLPLSLEETQSIDVVDTDNIKKVCVTGKMDVTRTELKEILAVHGFEVTSTVTKDCYALITASNETTSSKYKKAIANGITVLNYTDNKTKILDGEF